MPTEQSRTKSAAKPNEVTRRTVVKGAAWSVPVIAASAAVPAEAASQVEPSCDPQDYLAKVSNNFNPRPSGYRRSSNNGAQDPHWLSTTAVWNFTGKVEYLGNEVLPVGSQIIFWLGNNSRSISNMKYTIVSGANYIGEPVRTWDNVAKGYLWTFTTVADMPSGTVVQFDYSFTSGAHGNMTAGDWNGGAYTLTRFIPNICGQLSNEYRISSQLEATPRLTYGINGKSAGGMWFARVASY